MGIELRCILYNLHKLDHHQAFGYYRQALALAQKTKYLEGIVRAHNALGANHLHQKKFTTSFEYLDKALKLAQKHQIFPQQVAALNHLGMFYLESNLPEEALKQLHLALNIAQQHRLSLELAHVNVSLSKFHVKRGNLKKALSDVNQALKIARDQKDKRSEYLFLGQQTNVFMWQNNWEALLNGSKRMLQIAYDLKDSSSIARVYNNMAGTYNAMNKTKLSLEFFDESLAISKKIADTAVIFATFHNLGVIYADTKAYDKALKIHQEGIEYARAKQDSALVGVFMMSIAKLYVKQAQHTKAIEYANNSIPYLKKDKNIYNLNDCYRFLAFQYHLLKKFDQAYHYQTLHTQAQDSLFREKNTQAIAQLEQNFQIKEQKKALELLQKEAALQKQRSGFQLRLRNYALIGLVLSLFILVLLYNRHRLRHRIIQQQRNLLQEENALYLEKSRRLDVEQRLKQEENKRLLLDLDYKNRELATTTMLIQQKNEVLQSIQSGLLDFESQIPKKWSKNIHCIQKIIRENTHLEDDWERLQLHFQEVHPNFFHKLQNGSKNLSKNDLRMCAYIKINLSNKEIARLLNVEFRSIQMAKYRLKKKLALSKDDDLNEFVQQL